MAPAKRRSPGKKATARQRSLLELGRGGYRENSGRPRSKRTRWVRRRGRAPVCAKDAVHVNIRLKDGLPRLRNKRTFRVLKECFALGGSRFGFRLLHYSVMGNHIHWIVEADDRKALSRGMQGLLVRIARALNRLWGRSGTVFSDRYHDHVLRSPREVRNAVQYVLNNARKHGIRLIEKLDPFASGGWFDGWATRDRVPRWPPEESPLARARSWVMTRGLRRVPPLRILGIGEG